MSDLFDDDVMPDWLDGELWTDFIANRKQIKAEMTAIAQKRMLRKLERWSAAGINVNECLERSIINRWKDIYEPDRRPSGSASDLVEDLFARGVRLDLPDQGRKRPH